MTFLNYIRELPRTIETIVPLPPCPAPLSELQFAKRKIFYFSYPFGTKNDFDFDSESIVKELGFRAAFSNFQKNVHKGDDLYRLPRRLVRNWNLQSFSRQLKSFFLQ